MPSYLSRQYDDGATPPTLKELQSSIYAIDDHSMAYYFSYNYIVSASDNSVITVDNSVINEVQNSRANYTDSDIVINRLLMAIPWLPSQK